MTYSYNAAQQPVSAVDNNGINFATNAHYFASGALGSVVSGATASFGGIRATESYNIRLQPNEIRAAVDSQPAVLDLVYNYTDCNSNGGNSGNVCGIGNYKFPDHSRDMGFGYDHLNRLVWGGTPNMGPSTYWGQSFQYDPWGNMLVKNVVGGDTPLNVTVTGKNQVTTWCYDVAGNVVDPNHPCPATPPAGYPNFYDAENRLARATVGTATTSFDYDADGQRVKKLGGTNTLYWYGPGGVLEETDLNGALQREYVFFGGKRTARVDANGAIHYYFADHLGSADVVTNATASIIESESVFYPFGGERVVTDLGIDNRYKFTGKERDPETGCDYFGARYYCNPIGRFITPDWAAKPVTVPYANFGNPQSLNLYSYVKNNPTTFGDADGHCDVCWQLIYTVAQSIAFHFGNVATTEGKVRAQYNARVQEVKASQGGQITSAQRTALQQEARQGSTSTGMALAEAHDAKTAAAKAAKAAAGTLEESAGRTNPVFNAAGKAGEVAGPALTAVGVAISVKNVVDAPQDQKVSTAVQEGGGWSGAIAGGELGAALFSETGPGALLGGIGGAIIGGVGNKAAVQAVLSNPDRTPNSDNEGCSHGSGSSCR